MTIRPIRIRGRRFRAFRVAYEHDKWHGFADGWVRVGWQAGAIHRHGRLTADQAHRALVARRGRRDYKHVRLVLVYGRAGA